MITDSCARNHVVVGGPDGSGEKNCCGGGSACGWAWCEAEGKCTQVWDCPVPCTKEYICLPVAPPVRVTSPVEGPID